jgi:hypothetical protein
MLAKSWTNKNRIKMCMWAVIYLYVRVSIFQFYFGTVPMVWYFLFSIVLYLNMTLISWQAYFTNICIKPLFFALLRRNSILLLLCVHGYQTLGILCSLYLAQWFWNSSLSSRHSFANLSVIYNLFERLKLLIFVRM